MAATLQFSTLIFIRLHNITIRYIAQCNSSVGETRIAHNHSMIFFLFPSGHYVVKQVYECIDINFMCS